MESKELRTIADGMMDNEAAVMAKILTLREPQPIDAFQSFPCVNDSRFITTQG